VSEVNIAPPPQGDMEQIKGPEITPTVSVQETVSVPTVGRRAAFRDVRRELTAEELSSPGIQKLLLDMLEEADDERETLKSYLNLYHEADKKAAVLTEQLTTQTRIEVFFGVGIGLGGAILGLAPSMYVAAPLYGVITAVVGLCMIIGSTVGRVVKK